MVKLNTLLFEVKSELGLLGIYYSDNAFSREMLSKSSRYMSWLRSTKHDPAMDSLISLYTNLDDMSESYERSGNLALANQIDEMADTLWNAIRHASLAQGPKQRVTRDHRKLPKDIAQSGGAVG